MARDIDDLDLPLQELFHRWPATSSAFLSRRMLCVGCPIAQFHTIADACQEYALDEASFRRDLQALRPAERP